MAADPLDAYERIADVTRMSEWSPESAGAECLRASRARSDRRSAGIIGVLGEVEHDLHDHRRRSPEAFRVRRQRGWSADCRVPWIIPKP